MVAERGVRPQDSTEPLAFDALYARYSPDVYRFCLLQTGDPSVAEDLAADTLASAFKAYDPVSITPDHVRPWLFRIARNAVIDHWRRRRRFAGMLQFLGRNQFQVEDVEAIAARNAELARMIEVMSRMKVRDRKVLGLRFGADLSYREIAEVLGISENTVGAMVHRAMERFRHLDGEMP